MGGRKSRDAHTLLEALTIAQIALVKPKLLYRHSPTIRVRKLKPQQHAHNCSEPQSTINRTNGNPGSSEPSVAHECVTFDDILNVVPRSC